MSEKRMIRILAESRALRISFRKDPLGTVREMEDRFGYSFANLKPEHLDLIAGLSDEEFDLLIKLGRRGITMQTGAKPDAEG